jgi:hypothetical protein
MIHSLYDLDLPIKKGEIVMETQTSSSESTVKKRRYRHRDQVYQDELWQAMQEMYPEDPVFRKKKEVRKT